MILGAACCLVLAACGTTVPTDAGRPAAAGSEGVAYAGAAATTDDGLGMEPAAAPPADQSAEFQPSAGDQTGGSSAAAPVGGAAGDGGAAPASGSSSGEEDAPSDSGSTTGGTTAPARRPGVTADTVFVGARFTPNSGEANAAIGAAGLESGDQRNYYNALIRDLNRRGGVAGRKVKPVYYRDTQEGSQDARDQAACTHWTQDKEVFAMVDESSPILLECAAKAGAVITDTTFSRSTEQTYARYPNFVEISAVNLQRIGPVTVDGLHRSGYFSKGAVIGLITWDEPAYRTAVKEGFTPAFARHGLSPKVVEYIKPPQTRQNVGDTGAAVSSAVLKFRTEGVTHVLIADGPAGAFQGTGLTLLFFKSASSQNYYPAYGLNTTNSPVSGLKAGLWTNRELKGSHAVMWDNEDPDSDKGIKANTQRKRCFKLMRDNGVQLPNENAKGFALAACDEVWFFEAVGNRAPSLSVAGFMQAVDGLGSAYRGPAAYANFFGPQRHDGVAAARNAVYKEGCGCFRFTTGAYRLR